MPTRTVRMALPTFLEKLSKHNDFRKRRTHAEYNDLFETKFPWVEGYDKDKLLIPEKREWLAAVNWLAYHGKRLDAYDALTDDAINLLRTMLKVEIEFAERVDKVVHLVQIVTERQNDEPDNPTPSEDSSGTDAASTRRRGTRERRSSQRKRGSTDGRPERRRTSRARSTSRPKAAGDTSRGRRSDEDSERGPEEEESESFSSSSGSASPRRDEEGRTGHRHLRRDQRRHEREVLDELSESDEDSAPRRPAHAERRSSSATPRSRTQARSSSQRRARFAEDSMLGSDDDHEGQRRNMDRRDGADRRDDGRPRIGARASPRNVPQWQPVVSDTDDAGSQRSGASESELDATDRRAPRGRHGTSRLATSRSPSPARATRRDDSGLSPPLTSRQRAEVARFEKRQQRRDKRARELHHSDSDRDDDLAPTRFLAMIHAEAPRIVTQCGCALCKVYDKIHSLSAKHIMRGATACYTRFKKPLESTRRDDLREWAAMLFWCLHPIASSSWSTAPKKERQYVSECLLTPKTWNNEQRLTYAATTVKLLREETTTMMQHKAKYDGGSAGGGGTFEEPRVTPTRAGLKNAFLLKLRSLEFNPVEWLDASESKDLMSMRKLLNAGGTTTTTPALIPYASAPWLQLLSWPPTRPMNYVQAGRMLSVALRTHSEAFTAQLEQLARSHRADLDERLFGSIDTASRDRDIGRLLICANAARQYASDILDSALTSATEWHRDIAIPESKIVLEGRTRQKAEFPIFFQTVQKSIEMGSSAQSSRDQRDTFTRGAWLGFFEGLRAGRHSAELIKSTMKRGRSVSSSARQGLSSSDKSGSSKSDSEGTSGGGGRKRRKKRERRDSTKRQADGDGKSGARGKASGVRCKFQVNFPSSKSILGPKLGVECSAAGPCPHCSKTGHWSGECPLLWATNNMRLPGYRPSGKRVLGSWDAEKNPKKETAREWVRFLQDKKHFPAGGVPANEPNAPSLAAFQAWVGKAAA